MAMANMPSLRASIRFFPSSNDRTSWLMVMPQTLNGSVAKNPTAEESIATRARVPGDRRHRELNIQFIFHLDHAADTYRFHSKIRLFDFCASGVDAVRFRYLDPDRLGLTM